MDGNGWKNIITKRQFEKENSKKLAGFCSHQSSIEEINYKERNILIEDKINTYINNILIYAYILQIALRFNSHSFCLQRKDCRDLMSRVSKTFKWMPEYNWLKQ